MTVFRRKVCRSCGEEKVVSKINFYRHKGMADGFLNDCIPCYRQKVKENRELKADYYREYDAKRNSQPHRIALRRAYEKTPAGKAVRTRANRVYRRFKALEARA